MKVHTLDWQVSKNDSYYAYVPSTTTMESYIPSLLKQGKLSKSGRARMCFHHLPSAKIHLMLIHHDNRTIVPIHKHRPFGEYVIISHGSFKLTFFDSNLSITEILTVNRETSPHPIFIPANKWHRLEFDRPTLFYEISEGPFDAKCTEVAEIF